MTLLLGLGKVCKRQYKIEVEATASQFKRKNRPRSNPQGRFLVNSLDPKTQAALFQWRQGKY